MIDSTGMCPLLFPIGALFSLSACQPIAADLRGSTPLTDSTAPTGSGLPADSATAPPEEIGSACEGRTHPALEIDELLAANVHGITDLDGDTSDWVEVVSHDTEPVSLSGWSLRDGGGTRWRFPDLMLDPGAVLLIFASGKDRADTDELHTSFSLAADGDAVQLIAPDGCPVHAVAFDRLYGDVSIGHPASVALDWGYFLEPTPGAANTTEARPGFAEPPTLTPEPGFHAAAVTVSAAHADPTATIRLTLDGAAPTEDSEPYAGPFALEFDTPLAVVRAVAFVDGLWPSRVTTATYSTTPSILEDGLKVVSLVVDPFDLYDEDTGIYAYGPEDYTTSYPYFGANFWEDWERDAHVELWTVDGARVLSQDVGVKIHGGYTRAFEQKSFRLIARSAYGPDTLDHQFFPNQEQASFAVMVLEGAGDWCPTHTENSLVDMLFRDEDDTRLPTIDSQAWEPTVVYLNGVFWGLYAFR